jgi:hypothetical protein
VKYIIFLLAILSLSSCNQIIDTITILNYDNKELAYHPDWENLDSFRKISYWINQRVEYKSNKNSSGQDPQTTLDLGTGNCTDYALLFMNIAYYGMDIKMNLITVKIDDMQPDPELFNRSIIQGGFPDHTMIYYNQEIIEPQNGYPYIGEILYIYSFDEIFK